MKKILSLSIAFMLCLSFAGCGQKQETNTSGTATQAADKSGKVYKIATDTAFPPFEIPDAGGDSEKITGIDIDILKEIAKDQGFDYELEVLGFDASVVALEANQVDGVIAGMSITDKRKQSYDFSEPYYDSGVVMAIAANNNDVKSYADLAGKHVAAKRGTEGADFAEKLKAEHGFELTLFDDSPTMYMDVTSGNSVACFEDHPVMGYGIAQGNGLKMVTDKEQGSSYGFAVLKGKNPELLEMFDKGLENIKANGKYQEILDKYISKD